jgi:predicted nucleic acid-binding protein
VSFVVDASVTLSWYFQDEVTPASEALLDKVAAAGALAPSHWRLEVANGFHVALRRGRISREYRDSSLRDLAALPIEIDTETAVHAWDATLALADRFGLTPYDAAYLELAIRRNVPLATLDAALRDAGAEAGVTVL